jgi:hypothetical protein
MRNIGTDHLDEGLNIPSSFFGSSDSLSSISKQSHFPTEPGTMNLPDHVQPY